MIGKIAKLLLGVLGALFIYFTMGLILLLILLSGCSPKSAPPEVSEQITETTVEKTREVQKDTLITVPGGLVEKKVKFTVNKSGQVDPLVIHEKQGNATLILAMAGNELTAICKADSLQQLVSQYRKELATEKASTKNTTRTIRITKKVVPLWYVWQNRIAWFFEVLLFLWLLYRVWIKRYVTALENIANIRKNHT